MTTPTDSDRTWNLGTIANHTLTYPRRVWWVFYTAGRKEAIGLANMRAMKLVSATIPPVPYR
jgi:hypothetical protein